MVDSKVVEICKWLLLFFGRVYSLYLDKLAGAGVRLLGFEFWLLFISYEI